MYRPPDRDFTTCENYLQDILSSNKSKTLFLTGDFNINLLDFESNEKGQSSREGFDLWGLKNLLSSTIFKAQYF